MSVEKKSKPYKLPNRNNWVKQKLRFASLRWPARTECLKRARVERGRYKCSMCQGIFKVDQVDVDHIQSVVPINNEWSYQEIDWNIYIPRLLCDVDELQVLCKICHEYKTQIEDTLRAKFYQEKKLKKKLDKKDKKE